MCEPHSGSRVTSSDERQSSNISTASSVNSSEFEAALKLPDLPPIEDTGEQSQNMIPRSESPSNIATVATGPSPSPLKRNASGSRGAPLMSMELSLRSIDVALDGGLASLDSSAPLFASSDDAKLRITTSDFVKDIILEEGQQEDWHSSKRAATAMVELTEKLGRITTGDSIMTEKLGKMATGDDIMTEKLGRIATGDEIMTENIRLSSREWVGDFKSDSMRSIDPNLFVEGPKGEISYGGVVVVPPQSMPTTTPVDSMPPPQCQSEPPLHDPEEYDIPLEAANHLLALTAPSPVSSSAFFATFDNPPIQPVEATSSSPVQSSAPTKTKSPSSSIKSKTKRRKKRVIDETQACEPTENDVLFGRGGFTNTHPGNIKFRQTALDLRSWYEQSTKEEKYKISDLLVESVKSEGHRFLERGSDGCWHEVIGNGARKKASQALREKTKRKVGGSGVPLQGAGTKENDKDDGPGVLNSVAI